MYVHVFLLSMFIFSTNFLWMIIYNFSSSTILNSLISISGDWKISKEHWRMENDKEGKICTLDGKTSNNPMLNVEFLPNEILMNIFSHLSIKELYRCAKVSKKFRHISHDKSFWKCINLYDHSVSCEFITQIIYICKTLLGGDF